MTIHVDCDVHMCLVTHRMDGIEKLNGGEELHVCCNLLDECGLCTNHRGHLASTWNPQRVSSADLHQIKYGFGIRFDPPEECCICLELFTDGQLLVKLPCGHFFHAECISSWLVGRDFCPLCKQVITRSTNESETEHEPQTSSALNDQQIVQPNQPSLGRMNGFDNYRVPDRDNVRNVGQVQRRSHAGSRPNSIEMQQQAEPDNSDQEVEMLPRRPTTNSQIQSGSDIANNERTDASPLNEVHSRAQSSRYIGTFLDTARGHEVREGGGAAGSRSVLPPVSFDGT